MTTGFLAHFAEMPDLSRTAIRAAKDRHDMREKEVPEPADNEVLIKVEACGICHGDAIATISVPSKVPSRQSSD